ncbi:MAG: cytochrome c3 family protein [Xanthomonadales bacterium]|nr:cytochrome c3 family protein [Xanthomonadales bacterium]
MMIGLVGVVGFIFGNYAHSKFSSETSPVQPIAFSHKIHVSQNGIPCLYCHSHADKSPSAGVPSVEKCMGCHSVIATDRPEIKKLHAYWEKQEPIPWIKVHDVPDFVHFTHKRHIQAGLECQQCHGPIETMPRVTRVSTLKMPWCVDCHTELEVEHGRDCLTCHK